MWDPSYETRLADWYNFRKYISQLDLSEQLIQTNNWWFQAPMVNSAVQWNQWPDWPDPWTLLTHSGYCELARALGIVYTLMLIDEPKYTDLSIAQIGQDNLVLVDQGKYILNWAPREVLNINSIEDPIRRSISSKDLQRFLT